LSLLNRASAVLGDHDRGMFYIGGGVHLLVLVLLVSSFKGAQEVGWSSYQDPMGRLTFSYPESWGSPDIGTNSGFGNRARAWRFPNLPGLGGELALLQGRVTLDVQAFGGLYDPIALEVFPDDLQRQVIASLPPVTPQNFCALLGAPDHLPSALTLPPAVRGPARDLDHVRNGSPRVVRCEAQGSVLIFDKEATFETPAASARQHIFGAVRFLPAPYSAATLVRALNTRPSDQDLATLVRVVQSFVTRN